MDKAELNQELKKALTQADNNQWYNTIDYLVNIIRELNDDIEKLKKDVDEDN